MSTVELVIEGRRKVNLLRSLRELWAYRSTVMAFAERNIRVQYKQAALGVAWAVLQPLTFVVVFTFIFGRLIHLRVGGGVNYAGFALSSQVAWGFLSAVTGGASGGAIGNSGLMRKVYFPREVPGVATMFSSLLNLGIVLILFVTLGPFLGAHLSWTLVLVPFLLVPVALLGIGVGLALGALNVYYRDFGYLFGFFTQIWFYASPVVYPLSVVKGHLRGLYIALNPAVGLMESFRRVLTLGQLPDMTLLGISLVQTLVVGTIGYLIFKRLEPLFADVA